MHGSHKLLVRSGPAIVSPFLVALGIWSDPYFTSVWHHVRLAAVCDPHRAGCSRVGGVVRTQGNRRIPGTQAHSERCTHSTPGGVGHGRRDCTHHRRAHHRVGAFAGALRVHPFVRLGVSGPTVRRSGRDHPGIPSPGQKQKMRTLSGQKPVGVPFPTSARFLDS